ncbi:MAG: lauroyl acyltransferase [Spirochaetota bacterium]
MKNLLNLLSFGFAYSLYIPFRILPYRVCLAYGVFLANLLYPLAKKHRRIALENLSHAFPEMDEKEKQNLLKKHFKHLGVLLAGTLYAPRINQAWMDRYLVYEPEMLALEQKTIEEKIGVVLVSGHLGTWELLVQFMGLRFKGGGIYKEIRNPYVDRWVQRLRSNNGIVLVEMKESSKVIKMLKEGYWVGFGSDQNAGKAGVFVDFCNRPASTFQGPAMMAYVTGAKMLLYSALSGEKGKVIVRVREIGCIDKKQYPDKKAAIKEFTKKWTKALEEEVKLYPEQYFWVHRRWRTKPGDFPGQEFV